jgi:hypothetical protein
MFKKFATSMPLLLYCHTFALTLMSPSIRQLLLSFLLRLLLLWLIILLLQRCTCSCSCSCSCCCWLNTLLLQIACVCVCVCVCVRTCEHADALPALPVPGADGLVIAG